MGEFNTSHIPMDRSFRQEINKETLNNTLDQLELIDVYRVFHQKKKKKKKDN